MQRLYTVSYRLASLSLLLLSLLLLGLLPLGCSRIQQSAQAAPSGGKERPAHASVAEAQAAEQPAAGGYVELLSSLDERIMALRQRADGRADDWLTRERLAGLLLQRAGLSGQLADYAQCEKVLDEAFAIAPAGSGPQLLAARFNYGIHRLDRSEELLAQLEARALGKPEDALASRLLRAQIALQRGQYRPALDGLQAVAAAVPEAARGELALYHAQTGGWLEAEALHQQALAEAAPEDGHGRAWTLLQLAVIDLERGRYEQMLARLKQADEQFPGWWLVREHMAEAYTLLGQDELAAPIYEEVIAQTGLPQFMEALAGIHQRAGRTAEADRLLAEAGRRWDAALLTYPEAAGGHGLEFYLEHGSAERALELARANFATRPGSEARVLLAEALLKGGEAQQAREALEVLKPALASPCSNAGLHSVAGEVLAALGRSTEAQQQHALAQAINPR